MKKLVAVAVASLEIFSSAIAMDYSNCRALYTIYDQCWTLSYHSTNCEQLKWIVLGQLLKRVPSKMAATFSEFCKEICILQKDGKSYMTFGEFRRVYCR